MKAGRIMGRDERVYGSSLHPECEGWKVKWTISGHKKAKDERID